MGPLGVTSARLFRVLSTTNIRRQVKGSNKKEGFSQSLLAEGVVDLLCWGNFPGEGFVSCTHLALRLRCKQNNKM